MCDPTAAARLRRGFGLTLTELLVVLAVVAVLVTILRCRLPAARGSARQAIWGSNQGSAPGFRHGGETDFVYNIRIAPAEPMRQTANVGFADAPVAGMRCEELTREPGRRLWWDDWQTRQSARAPPAGTRPACRKQEYLSSKYG